MRSWQRPPERTAGRVWIQSLAVLLTAGAMLGSAVAQDSRARDAQRSDAQWIESMRNAAMRVNYSGTVVYEAGGRMRSSRVTHLYDGRHSIERIETLDGKLREFIRRRSEASDEVQCLIPESRRIRIEHRVTEESFPSLSSAPPEEILQLYRLKLGGVERVAGVEAQALALEPKDDGRFGYRLWVDRATGLLLKAQTVSASGEVLEQVAFSQVRIGERIDRSRVRPGWSTEGWSIERSEYQPTDLAAHGWQVTPPAGFRKTREVMRRIGGAEVLQAVFSDGLATISVFIEPGSSGKPHTDGVRVQGPTAAYGRPVGNALVTVVGEVPPGTIRAVASSVEFRGQR